MFELTLVVKITAAQLMRLAKVIIVLLLLV